MIDYVLIAIYVFLAFALVTHMKLNAERKTNKASIDIRKINHEIHDHLKKIGKPRN